jgi:hypothetical protein
MVMAMGGIWWGDSIKGESAATVPLLALTMIAGSVFFLLAPLVLPTLDVNKVTGQGWGNYFGGRIWLALIILIPGFFLWGAAPPFLAALAFPEDRGIGKGLFPIFSLTLVALALGALSLWWWPAEVPPWLERLIGLPVVPILIIGLWLWLKTPIQDRRELPFWPSPSLGLWTGDKVYGQEVLVSSKKTKTLTPILFLGTVAGSTAAAVWTIPDLTGNPSVLWLIIPISLAALSLGALVLGPVLAAAFKPIAALSISLFFLAAFLVLGPDPPSGIMITWICLGVILIPIGALWPLAARVSLVRYGFIPSSLGHVNFWLMGGLLIGLTITTAFLVQYPQMADIFYQAAIICSILALAISWSWHWFLGAILAIIASYFFIIN